MKKLYAVLALPFAVAGWMVCSILGPIALAFAFVYHVSCVLGCTGDEWLRQFSPAGWTEVQAIAGWLAVGTTAVFAGVLLNRAACWLQVYAFPEEHST